MRRAEIKLSVKSVEKMLQNERSRVKNIPVDMPSSNEQKFGVAEKSFRRGVSEHEHAISPRGCREEHLLAELRLRALGRKSTL